MCMTQLITALVSIHISMTFLADMYGFLDPHSRTVLFSVDDRSLFPVSTSPLVCSDCVNQYALTHASLMGPCDSRATLTSNFALLFQFFSG